MSLIIGIDPGPEMSAVVTIGYIDGAITDAGYKDNEDVLYYIGAMSSDLAIEYPEGRGMPVPQSVLDTCLWCGRFDYNINGTLYHPRNIRAHFCGTAKCDRSSVKQAIKDRYGEVGTKKSPGPLYLVGGPHKSENGESITPHLWDALAVALMHYELTQKGK